ncbi:caspase-1 [Danaus plexippus]|uniref:Caspase-1 n=1 Tax=Danaus plexippus plexippus TaxID=278856 RepID=A0A212EUQ8_DANPL|nr:caspase-1 [Danaus plexippus]OWR45225.1 caspase-1 [Danaus plexippus plexippus]
MADSEIQNNGSVEKEQRPNGGGDEGDAWGSLDSSSVHRYAKMPVHRNAQRYNMQHPKRGMALIFNHETFDIHNLKQRTGTSVDSDNLSKVLKSLGFKVTILNNLKSEDVNMYLQQTAEMDHSNYDCLLIAVLTHGEMGMLYAKDTHYKTDNLWYYFTADKCPSLAGKPKLFFIQACQGDKLDGGITLCNRTETDGSSHSAPYKIPIHADFLIVFSTVPGYFSWRNTTRGSWFIQALCEELRYSGTENDILTLLTFVAQRVALDFESNTPDVLPMHQQKQVPCITSMLTRLLVFEKKQM